MTSDIADIGLAAAATLVRERRASSVELVKAAIERADLWEPHITSLSVRCFDIALAAARKADRQTTRATNPGPLHGVPIVLKDVIDVKDVLTTASSRVLSGNIARRDAHVTRRLRDAGAIILGKAHTHEFAWGGVTPSTRNPWNVAHIPGGSSGGSAAATAVGIGYGSLGSDTAASIRSPASYCGLVGLKPSTGLVSTTGLIPLAFTLDTIGPLARSVDDAALLFDSITGFDPDDPKSIQSAVSCRDVSTDITGLRIGVPDSYFFDIGNDNVFAAVDRAITWLEDAGAVTTPVSLATPEIYEAAPATALLVCAVESAAWHRSWLDRYAELYAPDVYQYLSIGRLIPGTLYVDAQRLRRLIALSLATAMTEVDLLALPTQPMTAPRPTQDVIAFDRGGKLDRDAAGIRCVCPFNLADLPAVTVPCGFSSDRLPIGLQLAGPPLSDALLLRVARAVERRADLTAIRPCLPTTPSLQASV